MEETEVVIVGAGPSGLFLALLLAQYEVRSIVLEKEWEIVQDPRNIVMVGDGVRTVESMGLGRALAEASQLHQQLKFHLDSFKNAEYLAFPQNTDLLEQTLPGVLFMSQPRLEKVLREEIGRSQYCELKVGCQVTDRQETENGVVVEYVEAPRESSAPELEQPPRQIRARWLVGADGKKGIVRKRFLEPHGITQQAGRYAYEATWIAANLQISLPTVETHPELPVWKLGMSPEQVYNIFWPKDWHLVTHPKEAVAAGRFGPPEDRLWRHEFELESTWKDGEDGRDALEMFWANLTPSITRDASTIPGLKGEMTFPRDCIKVRRCRPFTFAHKVAGPTWHHNRTIIIGDAAHVFPPFGGQGIASGVRDAVGLACRLLILTELKVPATSGLADRLLGTWFSERRVGVDISAELTETNGKLTNQKWRLLAYLQVFVGTILCSIPWLQYLVTKQIFRDDLGYRDAKGGFFLPEYGGGVKVSQIFVWKGSEDKPVRSDEIMRRNRSLITVLVIADGAATAARVTAAKQLVQAINLDPVIVSADSVCILDFNGTYESSKTPKYTPCGLDELTSHGIAPFPGYDEKTFMRRLGKGTKFAILRPDTLVFALCKSVEELDDSLKKLKALVS